MLQVLNLCKAYKTKSGVQVQALKNITLRFPNKGMVFILGKSGSGKSTLLNVLGGLDSYDSGDIVIKGVSSQDFSQSDFDSYRNTYLGFIFQEYNLLDNFTIGENIEMALRLQNRKATPEEVDNILKKVDLGDVKNRRTNELSGGQKQRVAIARALIKNPEVIMADEPTGALDSTTGVQIFDLLKELSKEKLIIIVSHDREFSEKYADRIIEMKDGEVISDTTKVVKGKATKFINTDQNAVESDASGFKLIKSRLPLAHAVRMGMAGLKHKKFKLGFTIFLSLISFTMLGVSSSMATIDQDNLRTQMVQKSGYNCDIIRKKVKQEYGYQDIRDYEFDEDIQKSIDTSLSDVVHVYPTSVVSYASKTYYDTYTEQLSYTYNLNNNYSIGRFRKSQTSFINSISDFKKFGLKVYDFNNDEIQNPTLNNDEVFITNYMYDFFKKVGYKYHKEIEDEYGHHYYNDEFVQSEKVKEFFSGNDEEHLGDSPILEINSNNGYMVEIKFFKIKGYVDITPQFNFNDEKYKFLDSESDIGYGNDLYEEFCHYLDYSFANSTFMSEEGISTYLGYLNGGDSNSTYTKKNLCIMVDISKDSNIKKVMKMCYKNLPLTDLDKELGYESVQFVLENNKLSYLQSQMDGFSGITAQIFLYVGLAFFLFSGLLLSNFIANSISYQRREIGILRAIGARGSDVFKVYFSESFVVATITFILSTIASALIISLAINKGIASFMQGISLLSFGILNILIVLGTAFLSAIIATYIPTNHIAKKKPIDAIRKR